MQQHLSCCFPAARAAAALLLLPLCCYYMSAAADCSQPPPRYQSKGYGGTVPAAFLLQPQLLCRSSCCSFHAAAFQLLLSCCRRSSPFAAAACGLQLTAANPHPVTIPPPRVNGPGHVSSFKRGGGHWQGGPCFFFRRGGGSVDTRTGGPLTRFLVKNKKNSLCMHFLACAIGVNVVGTQAWYLLHLCGGCGAHVSHLLQLFHASTPVFLWFSTFVSYAFPSSHMQAHNSKYEEDAQLQLLKR